MKLVTTIFLTIVALFIIVSQIQVHGDEATKRLRKERMVLIFIFRLCSTIK